MNNEQQQLFAKIKAFSLDKPDTNLTFSQRLAKENNWNIKYTDRVIEEYRKFIKITNKITQGRHIAVQS